MALAMIRPYRHPKTGKYWVRKVVPAPLRAIVGKRELIESLGTKDCAEAKAKAGPVVARFEAIMAAARRGGSRLTEHDIEGICREWYRSELAHWWDDPGQPSHWATYRDGLHDQVERFDDPELENDPDVARRVLLTAEDRTEAAALLENLGHLPDDDTVARAAECLFHAKLALCDAMEPRTESVAAEVKAQRFPSAPPMVPQGALSGRAERSLTVQSGHLKVTEAVPTAVPMAALVNAWAAESGTAGKALYDRQRTANALANFLGHDDAAKVTADDVVRWKEARLAAGRSTKTVANDIGELRPIWSWGRANRKLAFSENPFAGLAPRHGRRAGALAVHTPKTKRARYCRLPGASVPRRCVGSPGACVSLAHALVS